MYIQSCDNGNQTIGSTRLASPSHRLNLQRPTKLDSKTDDKFRRLCFRWAKRDASSKSSGEGCNDLQLSVWMADWLVGKTVK